jgi:hexosaminidase
MKTILCPAPSSVRSAGEDNFDAPATVSIACRAPSLLKVAEVAAALAGRVCGFAINPEAAFKIVVSQGNALSGEKYRLKISTDGCAIEAGNADGVSRAFSTFAQLVLNGKIPHVEIEDSPTLPSRGYMLDISRDRVPARRTLLYILDVMWLLKFNVLELYTEHTFAFKGHEEVWENASPLRPADIAFLEDQCAARGIELIPNLNSLGHFGRWLIHEEYRKYSECPNGCTLPNGRVMPVGGTTLYPCSETMKFLGSLYDEYLPLFSSRNFNAGMDEPWELGMGRSKELCDKEGKHRVYLDHLAAVAKMAKKHGKSLQFWADIVLEDPKYVPMLPAGVTGMVWGYEAGHPFESQCAAFEKAGLPFMTCPGTTCWNSIAGRWENARANISESIRAAKAHGAAGALLTDWGDNGHHQPPCVSLPPMALFADAAWNCAACTDIEGAIDVLLLRDKSRLSGGILTSIGSIAERYFKTRIHNTSPAWKMFFAKADELPVILPPEDVANLPAFRDEIASIRGRIVESTPSAFGGNLVKREPDLAARMLDFGAFRLQKTIDPSVKCEDSVDRIIDDFEETWLDRSERGGLSDSVARIANIR